MEQGTQLREFGPQTVGRGGVPEPKAGAIYYVGMPQFINTGRTRVTVTRLSIAGVSPNVRALGYIILSTQEFDGATLIDWDPSAPTTDINFASARRYSLPYSIDAGKRSPLFGMAKVRLLRYPPRGEVRSCVVQYRTGGQRYQQKVKCEYSFGPFGS